MTEPYDFSYYMNHAVLTIIICALGGWAFGTWMGSFGAGFFAFTALDAVSGIALGLYVIAYKPHALDPHQ